MDVCLRSKGRHSTSYIHRLFSECTISNSLACGSHPLCSPDRFPKAQAEAAFSVDAFLKNLAHVNFIIIGLISLKFLQRHLIIGGSQAPCFQNPCN